MLLGKRLKELRIENGLTQRELGERVNVTKVSICCYENGTRVPTLETLTRLGEALNVDVDYLLGYDKEVKPKGKNKKITTMAKEEIEFIKSLREIESIHKLIIDDPKRALELVKLVSKKLN